MPIKINITLPKISIGRGVQGKARIGAGVKGTASTKSSGVGRVGGGRSMRRP